MHGFVEKDNTAPPGAAMSKRSTRRKPMATLFVLQLSQVSFQLKPKLLQSSSIFMSFQAASAALVRQFWWAWPQSINSKKASNLPRQSN